LGQQAGTGAQPRDRRATARTIIGRPLRRHFFGRGAVALPRSWPRRRQTAATRPAVPLVSRTTTYSLRTLSNRARQADLTCCSTASRDLGYTTKCRRARDRTKNTCRKHHLRCQNQIDYRVVAEDVASLDRQTVQPGLGRWFGGSGRERGGWSASGRQQADATKLYLLKQSLGWKFQRLDLVHSRQCDSQSRPDN
jgi:hypothetical protein